MHRILQPLFLTALIGIGFTACDLEKEIDIDLPAYESRFVVECYLEPGEPFSLLLSRSVPFFDPFPTLNQEFLEDILVDSAQVEIIHDGKKFKLYNQPAFNPLTRKVFNYFSSEKAPFDTLSVFELLITLPDDGVISGVTHILPTVPIDSLVVQFAEEDTLARVLTYFTDNTEKKNYYRRMFHQSSLDSAAVLDFSFDDRFLEGTVVLGTGYNYMEGDTIISTLLHIGPEYYRFLESLEDAVNANGNPFSQPSPIISNLGGTVNVTGIFTGITYDRNAIILQK